MANDDLLGLLGNTDLAAFNQSVQASDPYGLVGRSIGAWQPDMSTWNAPTSLGTSFGKAFLSGILQNYAQQNATEQMNKIVGVLPQLSSDPLHVATPEGVDSGAFSMLKGNAILRNLQQQALEKQEEKKFGLGLLEKYLGKKLEIQGEDAGFAALGQGGENPNSPAFKAAQLIKAEEDSARNELLTASKYPAVAKLQNTSTALAQLKNIKDINTASSDIPFATLFIGGLDGSVVKEGEYARVSGANPLLAKFQNQIEGALNGTSTLGVDIKKQMYNELVKTQKGLLGEALIQASPRLNTAITRGGLAKNILPFDPEMTFDEIKSSAPDEATLKSAAAALKAQGKSQAEIAQILRSQYGG